MFILHRYPSTCNYITNNGILSHVFLTSVIIEIVDPRRLFSSKNYEDQLTASFTLSSFNISQNQMLLLPWIASFLLLSSTFCNQHKTRISPFLPGKYYCQCVTTITCFLFEILSTAKCLSISSDPPSFKQPWQSMEWYSTSWYLLSVPGSFIWRCLTKHSVGSPPTWGETMT